MDSLKSPSIKIERGPSCLIVRLSDTNAHLASHIHVDIVRDATLEC